MQLNKQLTLRDTAVSYCFTLLAAGYSKCHRLQKRTTFYTHSDLLNKDSVVKYTLPPGDWPLSVSTADVGKNLLTVNINKAAGPD